MQVGITPYIVDFRIRRRVRQRLGNGTPPTPIVTNIISYLLIAHDCSYDRDDDFRRVIQQVSRARAAAVFDARSVMFYLKIIVTVPCLVVVQQLLDHVVHPAFAVSDVHPDHVPYVLYSQPGHNGTVSIPTRPRLLRTCPVKSSPVLCLRSAVGVMKGTVIRVVAIRIPCAWDPTPAGHRPNRIKSIRSSSKEISATLNSNNRR